MSDTAKEKQIPLGLIVGGEILFVVAGLIHAGASSLPGVMLFIGLSTVIGVAMMLVAALVTANLFKVSFGDFNAAILKLAGIYLASGAVAALMNNSIGGLLGAAVFFSLMMWLFELELVYVIVFTVMNWIVRLIVSIALVGMLR